MTGGACCEINVGMCLVPGGFFLIVTFVAKHVPFSQKEMLPVGPVCSVAFEAFALFCGGVLECSPLGHVVVTFIAEIPSRLPELMRIIRCMRIVTFNALAPINGKVPVLLFRHPLFVAFIADRFLCHLEPIRIVRLVRFMTRIAFTVLDRMMRVLRVLQKITMAEKTDFERGLPRLLRGISLMACSTLPLPVRRVYNQFRFLLRRRFFLDRQTRPVGRLLTYLLRGPNIFLPGRNTVKENTKPLVPAVRKTSGRTQQNCQERCAEHGRRGTMRTAGPQLSQQHHNE